MKVRLEWKPEDLWIGAYWRKSVYSDDFYVPYQYDLWICVLPCLPIHFTWLSRSER